MKKYILFGILIILSGCASAPQETYPYGMTEKEWNELSVKDKANIRRDFYFYEKGSVNFVNPQLEVEGRSDSSNVFLKKKTIRPASKMIEKPAETYEEE